MKKKILQIHESLGFGGIENVILQLSNTLDRNCFLVYTCSLSENNKNASKLNSDVNFYSFNYKISNLRGLKLLLRFPFYVIMIGRYLKRINPDVIHIHSYNLVYLLIAMSARLFLKKTLVIRTVHTSGLFYTSNSLYSKIQIKIEKIATSINDTIIVAISKQVLEICQLFFSKNANSIYHIYNGIDLRPFEQHNYPNIALKSKYAKTNDIIAIYVARFDNGKNHDFLIDLWKDLVNKQIYNIKLLLVGDGINFDITKRTVSNLKLDDYIAFTGNTDNVKDLLDISDIALFPSSFEGFSISLLEKMASGLPVIASDIPSFREVIIDKENGYLIPLDSRKQWTDTIILLGESIIQRKKIGESAKLRSQSFSQHKMICSYESLYKKGF